MLNDKSSNKTVFLLIVLRLHLQLQTIVLAIEHVHFPKKKGKEYD